MRRSSRGWRTPASRASCRRRRASVVKGQSALVNVAGAGRRTGDRPRRRLPHAASRWCGRRWRCTSSSRAASAATPIRSSLLGVISFVRQSFLDAQHQQLVAQRAAKTAAVRPPYDPALDALQPALDGQAAGGLRSEHRARDPALAATWRRSSSSTPVISGGREADQVPRSSRRATSRVIYNLNYPTRSRTLAPDADESIDDAARARQRAEECRRRSRRPASRSRSRRRRCVSRAISSATPARAVRDGLPADAALRALTLDAAKIAGADARVGIDRQGQDRQPASSPTAISSTSGMQIRHVFVDGRLSDRRCAAAARASRRPRRRW